ncbi:type 1 glutamine amidotransferase [Thioalkalicoccus limnaeus]|uniref:Type 1 glutamine amidotransferase n=1 Tax=Thioalkalicoccus limnaeus TaxID=120681 RepID=A0ABV4BBU8_9GAMM
MKRVQILQHVPFEGVGSMAAWLRARGAELRYTRFFDGQQPPPLDGIDLVIAMGGPMSVNDEARYPWLRGEKAFLREAVAKGTSVLGVCLGAQLIASALGSRVYANPEAEIGWYPIEGLPPDQDGRNQAFRFPPTINAFHWHGETFDLPPNAAHLARSSACEHQAFQVERRVIGLQCHLETTPEDAVTLVEHCRGDLRSGRWIQSEAAIRAAAPADYAAANALLDRLLDHLVEP